MSSSSPHEVLRNTIERRWDSWGVEYDEVMAYLRHRLVEVCELEEQPSEKQVFDCPDLLPIGLHPGHRTLDAIKDFQAAQQEEAA